MSKDDEYRYDGNFRSAPYDPMLEDGTVFILSMDSKKYTREQHEEWANWIAMCCQIKREHDENLAEIEKLRDEVQVRVVRGGKTTLLGQAGQRIVLEGIHWGMCLAVAANKLFKKLGVDILSPNVKVCNTHNDPQAAFIPYELTVGKKKLNG